MSLSDFSSPWWLLFLVVVAGLVVAYVLAQRRRQRNTMRFTNMELLERVAPQRPGLVRHVPTALVLVGLLFLTVALAGPTSDQRVPRNRATVMLVIDVSLSMEATDVQPTRLAAAQEAGKQFADGLTPGINLGLVAFAGTASVLVSPTTDREATKSAIDRLQLAERTATGESIFTAMQSIETLGAVLGGSDAAPPARIVLLSDGKQTVPENPDDPRGGYTAAREAETKGIPVSTISFGTSYGTVDITDEQGDTQRVAVPVDDPSLEEIARLSGGNFFTASSLEELTEVYDTLEEQIGYETTRGDASRPWLIAGVLFVSAGLVTALSLRQRVP
ncbi:MULTISPECIES: VWA domain-containing protein [Nocardiaceae]|uniref:Ca-activated chloride channel family protein n=1 Tax=Rhodococcoides corynebacterioides TaxID=53972 RepID=A0ABS2KS95_9NOCA|nr:MULTISPECIES: VWA domain-containing protein [Rhodococcus]MBM7414636.1 Ca-activated chloride channel family protein [Rhodococcus corynebacterioides]MBP1117098.1 Ca-activated chloride channel family protein [Rhodococcus sp. PvP016]